MKYQEITRPCVDCGTDYTLTPAQQGNFKALGYELPKRCNPCRAKKRDDRKARDEARAERQGDAYKNWQTRCDVCDAVPTVGATGLCGPCCWGEAETINGNW